MTDALMQAARDLIAHHGINNAALALGAALAREAEMDRRASGALAEAHLRLAHAVELAAAEHARAEDLYYESLGQAAHRRPRAPRTSRTTFWTSHDGTVRALIATPTPRTVEIHAWSSQAHGQGHTTRALRELRKQADVLVARNVVVNPDASPCRYWVHMFREGLVDRLIDARGRDITPSRRTARTRR